MILLNIELTGDGLTRLMMYQEKDLVSRLTRILPHVVVYARMAPKQKEWVINAIKTRGYITLMCGDGTNDVGALKHAHVGVAILPHCPEWVEKKQKLLAEMAERRLGKEAKEQGNGAGDARSTVPAGRVTQRSAGSAGSRGSSRRTGPSSSQGPRADGGTGMERQLAKLMKELEEEERAQIVKLGDASIAAPFSSKMSSIECSKFRQFFREYALN